MNGNTNTTGVFELAFASSTPITATNIVNTKFFLAGVNPDTDTLIGGGVTFEAALTLTGTAIPVIRAFVSGMNEITVSIAAINNTVTVASGAKFRGLIARCDNNFVFDMF